MAAKMAADFLENNCIHKISYHNKLLLGFWTQNDYIRRGDIQIECFMSFYNGLTSKIFFRGLKTIQNWSNFFMKI